MEYTKLGNTNIIVSKLCFGSLTISSLQANLSINDGARIIEEAFEYGVNFIDTAELYENYHYIRKAISGKRNNIVISTKSYSYSYEGARNSLEKALKELNTDYIDIFSLHEQESEHTLKGHNEAIEFFIKAKEKGYIRAFGISTHYVACVKATLKYNDIEVIHPIYNKAGLGIVDGSVSDMGNAIKEAYEAGKGIYTMKPLGGGNLLYDAKESLEFVLSNPNVHSIAVGMQSKEEVIYNTMIFEGKKVPENIKNSLNRKKRRLLIDFWCEGCGACIEACQQGALYLKNNRAEVNTEKCVLCGYCSRRCKDFCIKIV
ncbi:aldo/keto reductase [Lutispora thermophila]|uniref:Predicted oxidoreductase n=1 Tax=Lutispora thermophila DSM 19022 TaxID=1122184 RepID=A0A1M6F251_9FIRM|nr:aldo/keto reductase [Lutispora thermophila]SHI91716.1 Predicted oxidoreductase [Lutispora thermophila DSM 19022]